MLLKLEMILIIPEAKIMEGPDTYAEVGSSINLTCVIAQKPQLMYSGTVTVQKCGRNTAVSRLKIRDAQPTNSGNYICSPTNAGAVSSIVYVVKGYRIERWRSRSMSSLTVFPILEMISFLVDYQCSIY
nr:uncharacterized protein LOC107450524 isoform X2 [Parasteatoda tepidariorum]